MRTGHIGTLAVSVIGLGCDNPTVDDLKQLDAVPESRAKEDFSGRASRRPPTRRPRPKG